MLIPGTILFALWIAYGLLQWRRGAELLHRMQSVSPKTRRVVGSLLLFGSAGLLLGALFLMANNSESSTTLNVWQWIAVGLLGLLFVHAQTMAAAMLVSLAQFGVTQTSDPASSSRESKG